MQAIIKTNKGNITLNLYNDKIKVTVANFVNLCHKGFYNNLTFHRVINDFMIQGGCPLGTGSGGPGYNFKDEFHQDLKHDKPGILSMANSGPNSNGSQFFITHVETPWLDNKHSIFGSVADDSSQSIVNNIEQHDSIKEIEIKGEMDVDDDVKEMMDSWNGILDDGLL